MCNRGTVRIADHIVMKAEPSQCGRQGLHEEASSFQVWLPPGGDTRAGCFLPGIVKAAIGPMPVGKEDTGVPDLFPVPCHSFPVGLWAIQVPTDVMSGPGSEINLFDGVAFADNPAVNHGL